MSFPSDPNADRIDLAPYLPGAILSWYANAPEGEVHCSSRHIGWLVCVDISGFTALTNALSNRGKSGKEQLTFILNELFEGLCGAVRSQRGDILKFAGDALWADLGERPDMRRFFNDCLGAVARVNRAPTIGSPVELQVHLGAEYGCYDLVTFGSAADRLEVEPVGELVETVFSACDRAGRNSMVLGRVAASRASDLPLTTTDGIWHSTGEWEAPLLSQEGPVFPSVALPAISNQAEEILSKYIVAELNQRLSVHKRSGESSSEHREVALLFVYVEFAGSTMIADRSNGKTAAHQYFRDLFEIVSHCRGTIARVDPYRSGHKVLVLFGAPIKRENDELHAISAALQISQLASDQFRTRIGASFGPLYCGEVGSSVRREYTVMGNSINLAARLMGKSGPGEVLLDDQLRRRLPSSVVSEPIEAEVKGIEGAIQCHRLVGIRESVESAEVSELCSEQADIVARLRDTWAVASSGVLQVVRIRGGSGVGKSSILRAFRNEVRDTARIACRDAVLHEPGWVLRKFLQDMLGKIQSDQLGQVIRSQIEPAWLPLVADLLDAPVMENEWTRGLTAELRLQKRTELLQALLSEAATTPAVVMLDDFDEADERSRTTITALTESAQEWPCLIVLTESFQTGINQPEPGCNHILVEQTNPPSYEYWVKYFGKLLGDGKREQELVTHMLEASACNPGHLSELLQLLKSTSQLSLNPVTGKWELPQSSVSVTIPSTISDLYLSQLDQLPEDERRLLKHASVIGTTITRELLATIHLDYTDRSVTALLSSLEERQILRLQDGVSGYQFTNASMREALYECLPRSIAVGIHCRIAEYLMSRGETSSSQCAHHCWHGERWGEAFAHSLEAGNRSFREHSLLEAAALLDRCHQVLTTRSEIAISTEQRMSFYRVYAQLLDIEGRPGQYPAMLRRWRRECVQSGLALEGCRAAIETARLLWKQSRYRMTKRVLDQVISQAAGLGASEIEADGLLLRAELYRRLGDFPNACKSASEGLALAIQSDDQPKITDGQNKLGLAYWGMGKLAEAAICFEAALASVAAMESRYLTAKATNNLGIVLWESGRYREAMHRLQDAAELFRYVGDRRNEAYSKGNLAGLLKLMGQLSRAEQLYRQSGVIFERLKDSHAYHYTLGNLGDLALIRGDCESASRLFTDTMAFAHESGDQELQAECNIRFGELAYFSGEMESAQERFEDAINQATVIGSMEFLLRALIGSARKAVGMKDILGLDTLIDQIEEKAKAVPGSVALPEATFLRGEFYRLTAESDRALDCFREVRDFSSDQGIFELRLKSNCRLFELNPTERQAVDELKELAREFHRENQPLEFKTILGSVYFRSFAQSVIRALER